MAKIDPETGPRSPQDRPKTALRRIKEAIVFKDDFVIDFWSSWAPSWPPLGASWGLRVSSWGRLGGLLGTQHGPKIDPRAEPKRRPDKLDRLAGARWPQDRPRPPKMAKTHPKMAPRGFQDDPKRDNLDPQEDPKRSKNSQQSDPKRQTQHHTTQRNTDKTRQQRQGQD